MATFYVLEVILSPGPPEQIGSASVGGSTKFSQVVPAGTYRVRIRSGNACGYGGTTDTVTIGVPEPGTP